MHVTHISLKSPQELLHQGTLAVPLLFSAPSEHTEGAADEVGPGRRRA